MSNSKIDNIKYKIDRYNRLKELDTNRLNSLEPTANTATVSASNANLERNKMYKDVPSPFIRFVKATIRAIVALSKLIGKFLALLFTGKFPISHYVALILVIALFIWFFTASDNNSSTPDDTVIEIEKKQKKKKSGNPITNLFRYIFNKIKNFVRKVFRFFKIFRLKSPNSVQRGGKARTSITGRCDMLEWIEKDKFCYKTEKPKNIRWYLPEDKMSELNEIPIKLKDELTNKGNKLIIDIPYKLVNNKYYPDCNNMTYYNGEKVNGLLRQQSINSDYCTLVEKKSKKYNKTYKRSIEPNNPNVYDICK